MQMLNGITIIKINLMYFLKTFNLATNFWQLSSRTVALRGYFGWQIVKLYLCMIKMESNQYAQNASYPF